MGVEIITFPKKDLERSKIIRQEVIKKLLGKVFTQKALDLVKHNFVNFNQVKL